MPSASDNKSPAGFYAADIRRPRGRPDWQWKPGDQHDREVEDREALRPAGSLRAQAALSCIQDRRLPAAVVERAVSYLRARASGEAQRAFDEARRSGSPAQAAQQARAATALYPPDDLACARHLAETLPSRVRGVPGDELADAARAVESEARRLERFDKSEMAQSMQELQQPVRALIQSLVPHSVSAQLARLARDCQEQRDRHLRWPWLDIGAALVVPDGFRGRRPTEGRPRAPRGAQGQHWFGERA